MAKKKNRKKHLKHGRAQHRSTQPAELKKSEDPTHAVNPTPAPAKRGVLATNATSVTLDAAKNDIMIVSLLGLALVLMQVLLWYLFIATPLGDLVDRIIS